MNRTFANIVQKHTGIKAKHLHGYYYRCGDRIFQVCTQGTYTFCPIIRGRMIRIDNCCLWELEFDDVKDALKAILPHRDSTRRQGTSPITRKGVERIYDEANA